MRLATSATPRFPGHLQPNVPLEDHEHGFGANEFEDIPEVMERKIDSAVDHGVGMFVFDWCVSVRHPLFDGHPSP